MTVFDSAFSIVVGEEGGYSANPADPGNWTGGRVNAGLCKGTKFGISAAAYPKVAIANLSLDEAKAIYRRDYWESMHADEMIPALALVVFDAAINSGKQRATCWLQLALSVTPDGDFGPITLAAVQTCAGNGAKVIAEFQAQRFRFLASLPTWRVFGLGWARRLCKLQFSALQIHGGV